MFTSKHCDLQKMLFGEIVFDDDFNKIKRTPDCMCQMMMIFIMVKYIRYIRYLYVCVCVFFFFCVCVQGEVGGEEWRRQEFWRAGRHWCGGGCAYWPSWCYRMYDASYLAQRVRARFLLLINCTGSSKGVRSTCGRMSPADLSYWISWNIMV